MKSVYNQVDAKSRNLKIINFSAKFQVFSLDQTLLAKLDCHLIRKLDSVRFVLLDRLYVFQQQGFMFVPEGLKQELAPIVKDVLKQEFHLNLKDEAFTTYHVKPPT